MHHSRSPSTRLSHLPIWAFYQPRFRVSVYPDACGPAAIRNHPFVRPSVDGRSLTADHHTRYAVSRLSNIKTNVIRIEDSRLRRTRNIVDRYHHRLAVAIPITVSTPFLIPMTIGQHVGQD